MRLLRPLTAALRPGLLAVVAAAAAAEDLRPDLAALRAEMDRLWLDGAADHARVRHEDFYDSLRPFAPRVRRAVSEQARRTPKLEDASREATSRAIADAALAEHAAGGAESAPLRRRTLEFLLHRALPADLGSFGSAHDDAWFAAFLAGEIRQILAAERFEDAWDTVYRDAPVVAAWRRAHAPEPPPADRAAPPPPESAGPALSDLVEIDAARAWVGPWTGWNTDVREKDNRRAKRPARTVWIERHEVTCDAWAAYLRSLDPARRAEDLPSGWTLAEDGTPSVPEGRARHPVTGVTWAMAARYAESRGMRLPTEDEWDRAAGGGEKEGRAFPWGASSEGRTWAHLGVGPESPSAVDAFPDDVTPDGIVGLGGNVAEWTATYADRRDVPKSGPAAEEQVVVRGGSFKSRESECGATYRRLLEAGRSAEHVGFRCVMEDAEYRRRVRPGTEAK